MHKHHDALEKGLRLSTHRLEAMRTAAMNAGAWGFKLVGSGGGGCAVAWTPRGDAETVAQAMVQAGAKSTWIIDRPCEGARIELP